MRTLPGRDQWRTGPRGEAVHGGERIDRAEEAGLQARAQGALRTPGGSPLIIDVPELSLLMVDGIGDPNTSRDYVEAVEALFAVSYRVKFAVKLGTEGIDYRVMPLEGLW